MYSYKSTKAPAGYITGIILGDMLAALLKSYGYMLFNSEGQKKYQVYYKEIKNSVSKIDNGYDFPGKKYYYNKVEVEAYLKRIEGELKNAGCVLCKNPSKSEMCKEWNGRVFNS